MSSILLAGLATVLRWIGFIVAVLASVIVVCVVLVFVLPKSWITGTKSHLSARWSLLKSLYKSNEQCTTEDNQA